MDPVRWLEHELRDVCRPIVLFSIAAGFLLGMCARVYGLGQPLGLQVRNLALSATPGTHEILFWRVTPTPPGLTGKGSLVGLRLVTRPGAGGVWVQELHVAFWAAFAILSMMWLVLEVALGIARRIRANRRASSYHR